MSFVFHTFFGGLVSLLLLRKVEDEDFEEEIIETAQDVALCLSRHLKGSLKLYKTAVNA